MQGYQQGQVSTLYGEMIMRWKKEDSYRWHSAFAYLPRQIGDECIWWEPYQWRYIPYLGIHYVDYRLNPESPTHRTLYGYDIEKFP
jgi:hypothetical protein